MCCSPTIALTHALRSITHCEMWASMSLRRRRRVSRSSRDIFPHMKKRSSLLLPRVSLCSVLSASVHCPSPAALANPWEDKRTQHTCTQRHLLPTAAMQTGHGVLSSATSSSSIAAMAASCLRHSQHTVNLLAPSPVSITQIEVEMRNAASGSAGIGCLVPAQLPL